ncbi:hypothetical protein PGB90_004416 [Kerria lacca]
MTECEAVFLGREPIHGSANATALATLVKSLMRKSEFHRKYILRCSRDNGLQMVPHRRLEDEGFESDEDLTSLGSYEDGSSSIYVSDHALRIKCRNANGPKSSLSTGADATSGSVSSVGTDSANSSGASDNDETDNSFSHNVNHKSCESFEKKKPVDEVERFAFHEVAFCHTDPLLPKVIVWVVKTKRQSNKNTNEYSYGLEAIVFLCQSDEKFRALYKNFQEFSRRQKLEKPVRNRWKEEFLPMTNTTRKSVTSTKPTQPNVEKAKVKNESKTNSAMFNLVQRVDTDGVTHIEVTRPPTSDVRSSKMLNDSGEPSSIISINTPDSGDVKTTPKRSDKLIESVIRTEEKDQPPERPDRKKSLKNSDKDTTFIPPVDYSLPNREKVVRGQYVRVSVDQKTLSSPSSRGGWLFSEAKPCVNVLSYPAQIIWNRNDKEDYHEHSRRNHKTEIERDRRHRSKSNVVLRRSESPKRYPMPHRYVDVIQTNNSLPNRFFGRLKELTGVNQGSKFKRRNSIGDLANATNNYQQYEGKKFDKNNSLAKSTPNLKSMIKNKNGKFCKDGFNENEPKKVTFSAYATVQVVD